MKQVTLVALYGEKRQNFREMVQSIWAEIEQSELGKIFQNYDMNQIHGTLAGMEKMEGVEELYNFNIWEKEGRKVEMNFKDIHANIEPFFPIDIQFGGFKEEFRGFYSLGDTPFNRSFEINWNSNKVILIGWSMHADKKVADKKLLKARETLQYRHNIRPKMDNDNDLYMVIGELKNLESLTEEALAKLKTAGKKVERSIRNKLAENKEALILTMDDLFYVQYHSRTLDYITSKAWSMEKVKSNPDFIKGLY